MQPKRRPHRVIAGKTIKIHESAGQDERVVSEIWKNLDLVVGKYAEAERRGDVTRKSNSHGLTTHDYAVRLLADGIRKKGFMNEQPSSAKEIAVALNKIRFQA
ncbi:MAG: hypothetical protein ABSF10_00315 [Verrucomicrobiota bacterium]